MMMNGLKQEEGQLSKASGKNTFDRLVKGSSRRSNGLERNPWDIVEDNGSPGGINPVAMNKVTYHEEDNQDKPCPQQRTPMGNYYDPSVVVTTNSFFGDNNNEPISLNMRNDNDQGNIMGKIETPDRIGSDCPRLCLPLSNASSRAKIGSPESDKSGKQKNSLEVAVQKGILRHIQKSSKHGSSNCISHTTATPKKSNISIIRNENSLGSVSNESGPAPHELDMSMPRIAMQDTGYIDADVRDMTPAMPTMQRTVSDSSVETLQTCPSGRNFLKGHHTSALSYGGSVDSRASSCKEAPAGRSQAYLPREAAIQCRRTSSSAATKPTLAPTHSNHHVHTSRKSNTAPAPLLEPIYKKPAPHRGPTYQNRPQNQQRQGSGRRFPGAMPPSRQQYQSTVQRQPHPNASIFITVAPNAHVPLRRVPEVWKALAVRFYDTPHCPCCNRQVAVVADAAFLHCPLCTKISPLYGTIWPVGDFSKEPESQRYGLGLGMTQETIKNVFEEMYPRD